MRYRRETIPLKRIDSRDETYRITTDSSLEDLVASLSRFSLLNFPILEKKGSSYTIVSGFRRIQACRHLDWMDIDARVLCSHESPLERVSIAICENSTQRLLNLVEISRAYNMLSDFFCDTNALSAAASELGLPTSPIHIHKIRRLCKFPQTIQNAVVSKDVSLSIALELGHMEPDAGILLTDLFRELKIGLNKQQEILTLVKEIAFRDGVSVIKLLNTPKFLNIRKNTDLDRTQKRQVIRKFLKQRRYPAISQAEEAFEKQKKALKLGNRVHLSPPPYFEETSYTIKIEFRSILELKDRTSTLLDLAEHPCLKEMLGDA